MGLFNARRPLPFPPPKSDGTRGPPRTRDGAAGVGRGAGGGPGAGTHRAAALRAGPRPARAGCGAGRGCGRGGAGPGGEEIWGWGGWGGSCGGAAAAGRLRLLRARPHRATAQRACRDVTSARGRARSEPRGRKRPSRARKGPPLVRVLPPARDLLLLLFPPRRHLAPLREGSGAGSGARALRSPHRCVPGVNSRELLNSCH